MQSPDTIKEFSSFLIDTGSELNLIKIGLLKESVKIYTDKIYRLTGITEGIVETLGVSIITLENTQCEINIVPDNFPIEWDGILGVEYLKTQGAVLSFAGRKLILRQQCSIPFINHDKVLAPARTKKLIAVKVSNPTISSGYVARIQAEPGIYLGECLVKNREGLAWMFVINTGYQDVNLIIPPIELEEFTGTPVSVRTIQQANIRDPGQNLEERVNAIIQVLDLKDLNSEEKANVIALISQYPYQFYLPGDKLSKTSVVQHKIPTINEVPINVRQYRHPPHLRKEIQKQIQEMLDKDIIEESESPYNAPLLIIPKKPDSKGNKRWRIVIYFRALNEKTIASAYPLPHITEILDQLGKAKYFSTLDLASGFHQVPIDPADAPKTAFSTPYHHLQYKRMPMGLKGAPATFQSLMYTLHVYIHYSFIWMI